MKKSGQNTAPSMIDAFVNNDAGLSFVPIWIISDPILHLGI